MMITLTIYIFIIGYIIFKAFYVSIKPFNNSTNTLLFQDSISLGAMPFYSNMGRINLFAFFINFLFLSFISMSLVPDLITNTIAYCQDSNSFSEEADSVSESSSDESINVIEDQSLSLYSDNGGPFEKETKLYTERYKYNNCNSLKWGQYEEKDIISDSFNGKKNSLEKYINKIYKVSNKENTFIFHLNYENASIHEPLKMRVFEGLTEDLDNIFKNQEKLVQKINHIDEKSYKIKNVKNMYKELSLKNNDMLYLTSNAYNKIMLNNILMENPQIENFNNKAINTFISLEKIKYLSNANYNLLEEIIQENPRIRINHITIPLIKEAYLSDELQVRINSNLNNYCNENIETLNENSIENSLGIIDSFYSKFLDGHYFKEDKNTLSIVSIQKMGFSCPFAPKSEWYMGSLNEAMMNRHSNYDTDNEETRRILRNEEYDGTEREFSNMYLDNTCSDY